MKTFGDVFSAFGGPAKLAEAISIKAFHAQTMKTRDSIPPEYWPALVKAAANRGIEGITAESLMMLAARTAARRRESAGASA